MDKTYNCPRGNDFYIGIPMMMVRPGEDTEPMDVDLMNGVQITLTNVYGVSRKLEFARHPTKEFFVTKIYGDLECGTYKLTVKGWIQGRHVSSTGQTCIKIGHDVTPWNVPLSGLGGLSDPFFMTEPQMVVFNGQVMPEFSIDPDDMCLYVNDSTEREWEIDSEGELVFTTQDKEHKEDPEPKWAEDLD